MEVVGLVALAAAAGHVLGQAARLLGREKLDVDVVDVAAASTLLAVVLLAADTGAVLAAEAERTVTDPLDLHHLAAAQRGDALGAGDVATVVVVMVVLVVVAEATAAAAAVVVVARCFFFGFWLFRQRAQRERVVAD